MSHSSNRRLTEIDSLRGIAAMLVVLFHYTTRYDELYGHTQAPAAALPWGHFGVNLFFMISGFVIFMTLERTRHPMDFVVSRFSRLYPAYWVAVVLTFLSIHWLSLPGKEVEPESALLNLTMIHSLFNIPHVDGVYWTLEVELLFYLWAFLAYRLGLLTNVHWLLTALLVLRLAYFASAEFLHVDLPWIAYRLLILKFIPWFAAGIMVYRTVNGSDMPRRDGAILAGAIVTLSIVDGLPIALLCVALTAVLYGAACGRLAVLNHPLLVGLGTISYTLYLLHENIGWAMILRMEQAGIDTNAAIMLALACAIALSVLLTYLVEQPAMRAIRQRYKRRHAVGIANQAGAEK